MSDFFHEIITELNKLSFIIAPVFYKLVFLSITGVVVGAAILIIRKLFDSKIPPLWKYLMWAVVVFALIVPFRPQSNISLTENISMVEDISFRQAYNVVRFEEFTVSQEETTSSEEKAELRTEMNSLFWKSLIFDVIFPLVWFFGMCGIFIFFAVSKLYLLKKIKQSTLDNSHFQPTLLNCKEKLKIKSDIQIVYQDYIKSPALLSFIKPKIILPLYASELSDGSLSFVLLHELAHYKRRDMLVNFILLLVQAVHWFNPFVWLMFKFIREDMEVLNDSYVISKIGNENRSKYAKSLVVVLGLSHNISFMPKLLCMVDDKNNVKRRISMIKLSENFKKHKIVVSVLCLAIVCTVAGLFLTQKNASNNSENLLGEDISAKTAGANGSILAINKERGLITVKSEQLSSDNLILTITENTNFITLDENNDVVILDIDDFSLYDNVVVFVEELKESNPITAVLETIQLTKNNSEPMYELMSDPDSSDVILSINNTFEFPAIGKINEGSAHLDKNAKLLHVEIFTPIGQANPTAENSVSPLVGAGLKFSYDTKNSTLINVEFTEGANGEKIETEESEIIIFAERLFDVANNTFYTAIYFPNQNTPYSSDESNSIKLKPQQEFFQAILKIPPAWSFEPSNNGEENIPLGDFIDVNYIYDDDDRLLGYIGYNVFEPYEGEISAKDYHKTVYSNLRNSMLFTWDPYTMMLQDENSEVGIVDISYLNQGELANNEGAVPNALQLKTNGILAYNKELKVYVGIAFMPDVMEQGALEELAKTIEISQVY